MKLFVFLGLLVVQSALAVPTGDTTFGTKELTEQFKETKDDTVTDTKTTDLSLTEDAVEGEQTHERHERSACVESEDGSLLCKRNYGHGGELRLHLTFF